MSTATLTPRLRTRYNEEIKQALHAELDLSNVMLVPKIEKIVLNMGVGDAVAQAKLLDGAVSDMEIIAGQKAVITRAKKSLASFKLREGQAIGCKVTLRGDRMYEFLDRLISLAIPTTTGVHCSRPLISRSDARGSDPWLKKHSEKSNSAHRNSRCVGIRVAADAADRTRYTASSVSAEYVSAKWRMPANCRASRRPAGREVARR